MSDRGEDKVRGQFDAAEDLQPDPSLRAEIENGKEDRGAPPDDPHTPINPFEHLLPEGAGLPLNDTGNGKRFCLYYGEDVIWVPRVGWHVYDGKRWQVDADDILIRGLGQKIHDRLLDEVPFVTLDDWQLEVIASEPSVRAEIAQLEAVEAKDQTPEQLMKMESLGRKLTNIRKTKDQKSAIKTEHRKFAKSVGNSSRIDGLLKEGQIELAQALEDLDADPLTINTQSGVLRFEVTPDPKSKLDRADYTLLDHERRVPVKGRNMPQFITKMMPVDHDPEARCPKFDAFLERVQPDIEIRGFLQRWLGLSMTGLTGEQKFAFLYGSGANGKSVLVDLIAKMMGDYGATAKIESLTGRNRRGGGDATPDLIPLVGARFVRASEPDQGERLQEGMIKELTGGEPILVRPLHGDFIEVHPEFKLTMSGNHKPDIRGTDDGIWRRILLVPFDVQIPPEERDRGLTEALYAERSGILNWLIDGLLDYLESGLREPEKILDATKEYRESSDPIGTFLAECCLVTGEPSDFMTARDLGDAFNYWLDASGETMWGLRTVSNHLLARAGRYKDASTGKSFIRSKMKVTGYRGIVLSIEFAEDLKNATRNAQGRPVARNASSSSGEPDK
ncbi:DNA primase family protein [Planktotalea sp.]|uniref:DNA primase family protein n=1 Tax=Planktotalea sp. TaxID=2029877 RepID=UPI003D6AEBCD